MSVNVKHRPNKIYLSFVVRSYNSSKGYVRVFNQENYLEKYEEALRLLVKLRGEEFVDTTRRPPPWNTLLKRLGLVGMKAFVYSIQDR